MSCPDRSWHAPTAREEMMRLMQRRVEGVDGATRAKVGLRAFSTAMEGAIDNEKKPPSKKISLKWRAIIAQQAYRRCT